jgi:hypothetical protein
MVALKDVVDAVADLGGMGLKVKASQIRERLQLDEPEEGDEVIGGVAPPPVVKPDIPKPAVTLPPDPEANAQRRGWLGALTVLQSEAEPEVIDQLVARLAEDAAGALHGLTDQVRHAFDQARSMQDLVHRLRSLKLKPDELAEAMARGMALAEIVGQAAVVQELHAQHQAVRMASLTADERGDLADSDFAVPETRQLPMKDARHVKLAWDMVDRTHGLTPAQKRRARRRILARAKRLGVDTSGWEGANG